MKVKRVRPHKPGVILALVLLAAGCTKLERASVTASGEVACGRNDEIWVGKDSGGNPGACNLWIKLADGGGNCRAGLSVRKPGEGAFSHLQVQQNAGGEISTPEITHLMVKCGERDDTGQNCKYDLIRVVCGGGVLDEDIVVRQVVPVVQSCGQQGRVKVWPADGEFSDKLSTVTVRLRAPAQCKGKLYRVTRTTPPSAGKVAEVGGNQLVTVRKVSRLELACDGSGAESCQATVLSVEQE